MNSNSWRILAQNISDRRSLTELRTVLDKIEKCCVASDNHLNLADVIEDKSNRDSLIKSFGVEGFDVAVQTILKLSLQEYKTRSFVINADILGKVKLDFIYNMMKNFKFFDTVVTLLVPTSGSLPAPLIRLLNPLKKQFWDSLKVIPCGTLLSVYTQKKSVKKSDDEEKLALDQMQSLFENVQMMDDEEIAKSNLVSIASAKTRKAPVRTNRICNTICTNFQTPSGSLKVTVNKMDTFVHAGNAHLIMELMKDYSGKIMMFVLRDKKQPIPMNVDSIWSAEVRNGETVLYEFFGPEPTDDFLRELSRATNKYTQMDKVANE